MRSQISQPYRLLVCSLAAIWMLVPVRAQTVEIQKLLASDGEANNVFGNAVALEGEYALIGSPKNTFILDEPGSVYFFKHDGMLWAEEQILTASDGTADDRFGGAIAISGDVAVIGASGAEGNSANSGAAYVFRYDGVSWVEEQKLFSENGSDADFYGGAVAIHDDTILIGAPQDDSGGPIIGSAHVYRYDGLTWTEEQKLTASDGEMGDNFGQAVALEEDVAVVSAHLDDDNGDLSGSVYVFRFNGALWIEEQKLTASDGAVFDLFGNSVALEGNVILVGAPFDDGDGDTSGSVYVYRYNSPLWVEEQTLTGSDIGEIDQFGFRVALDDEKALVGAPLHDHGGDVAGGAGYLFMYDGTSWMEEDELISSDAEVSDVVGVSVALEGGTAIVGASGDDDNGLESGSTYVFDISSSGGPTPGTCARGDAEADLAVSDVRATLYNEGNLFWEGDLPSYIVPQASGLWPLFAAGIWVGGMVNGDLRMAAADYADWEYRPGPLDAGATLPETDCRRTNANGREAWDRIYVVSTLDVADYEQGGGPAPDLEDWPVGLGAPAVDAAGLPVVPSSRDQLIDLVAGERPVIYGTQTAFWVMNDVGFAHNWSGGLPLGIEVQVSAFAISDPDNATLDQGTFYRYTVVNRNSLAIEDAYITFWTDPDLGDESDDYVGSDPARSLAFAYNSSNTDASYGTPPPAIGFDLLSGAASAAYYENTTGPTGNPSNPGARFEAYNMMQGLWKDGTPITEGGIGYMTGGAVTPWSFSGDPEAQAFWSEVNADGAGSTNPPGDRRILVSTSSFALQAGESTTIDVAILFASGTDYLNSVTVLKAASDDVQARYDDGSLFETVGVNQAPIANDDSAETEEDVAVLIDVLANDSDPDGDPLSIEAIPVAPANGSAVIEGAQIRYTPDSGFFGTDDFDYTASDGQGGMATATVTITVNEAANQAPIANDDAAETNESVSVLIDVLANDSDPDGDPLSLISVADPDGGATSIEGEEIRYTPDPGFSGSDAFEYTVGDDRGGSAMANVTVTVNAFSISVSVDGEAVAGNDALVRVSVAGFDPTSGDLSYRPSGQSAFESIPLTPDGDEYTATIPASAVTLAGLDYYVELSDGSQTITFPSSNPQANPAHLRVTVPSATTSAPPPPDGTYRMVSVPLALNDASPAAVFVDDYGDYDPEVWRLLRWQPETESYVEFPELGINLTPGTALWLATRVETTFDVEDGQSVDASVSVELILPPGFSQIASPFAFPVAWNAIEGSDLVGPPAIWDGIEYLLAQDILTPWEGAFVENTAGEPVTLTINPVSSTGDFQQGPQPVASAGATEQPQRAGLSRTAVRYAAALQISSGVAPVRASSWAATARVGYGLRLVAEAENGLRDSQNLAAFAEEAEEGRDRYDLGEPPPPGEHIRLSFLLEENASPRTSRLAYSYQPDQGEGAVWEVEVIATAGLLRAGVVPVSITLVDEGARPDGYGIYVLDHDRATAINTENGLFTVTLSAHEPVRRLRLIIGTEEFAEAASQDMRLVPLDYTLNPAYPNPARGPITIAYQLATSSAVELAVYDLLGRRIAVLVDGEQDAGRHTRVWDARGLASGVYVYRLRAGTFTDTGKLILIR